ncbi:hypothetical protein A3G67_00910 [Candidatus Roizmanbacteria bacterium RIFCSPLOWO2_12_FULL_40_12]|uniref:Uncharacterized protein n=1 Tax=Candidatus Roizmanbacteria bacterium RIFCSPLOWO2_01_FULL_40_42 TaxID=1802066 RepID=A0A1F7J5T3_9BACT|nr:MAG: hypothetical protein A2779_02310 [Candidatus Roizmanbacteria bacterium RIFCSPHIGHO2_01_FULL_40_98]OGK28732.1 MAG: hypothetical protein A3C31_00950 [Candidatus Roizmanbacteria bacterium RIFCSPHIGHO2_02_FULL_40_53]OGK30031.1 MAG: hypothetical protein A2W49_01500 [Candidatus Roizmanbacteria bacterium RIFCSPHIGHO2_12_41_18]OGK36838.1 MAG: hypothetical protein A3E69_03890 [Candidatus Roizmanbacteria bacterium RIFCSPHIGHO2_12_FULL_40_130]OGK50980.1 MAG: hypothetical protein A3B50_03600 [Candi
MAIPRLERDSHIPPEIRSSPQLQLQRAQHVEDVWGKIVDKSSYLPPTAVVVSVLLDLGSIFSRRMEKVSKKSNWITAGLTAGLIGAAVMEARAIVKRGRIELPIVEDEERACKKTKLHLVHGAAVAG